MKIIAKLQCLVLCEQYHILGKYSAGTQIWRSLLKAVPLLPFFEKVAVLLIQE